ncbi:hypothetical protein EWM64_g2922 [Hericium alpestre]|uniref:Uncharacterized protein n=1 Tax=Hericium alpestre TaxID=135208 RepID=A0A4Z0A1Z0_9AGAM|nr:hypothetical protein EWM64_g2922 [Hericium alpestre]
MHSFLSVIGLGLFALPSILAAPLPGAADVADIVAGVFADASADVLPKDHYLNRRQVAIDGLVGEVVDVLDGVLGGKVIDRRESPKDVSDALDLANESYSAVPGSDEKIQNAIDQIAGLGPATSPPSADQLHLVNVKLAAIVKVLLFSKDAAHPASGSGTPPDYSKLANKLVILITKIYIRLGVRLGSAAYQQGVDDLKSRCHEYLPLVVRLNLKAFIALWGL